METKVPETIPTPMLEQPYIVPEKVSVPVSNVNTEQSTPVDTVVSNNNIDNNEKVNLDKLSEQKNAKLYEDDTEDDKFFDDFFSDD